MLTTDTLYGAHQTANAAILRDNNKDSISIARDKYLGVMPLNNLCCLFVLDGKFVISGRHDGL